MSEDRKAKAAARRAKRQARNTEPSYKLQDIQAEVNTGNPFSEKPKDIVDSTHSENGRVLDAAVVTADAEQISPITGKAEVMSPAGLAGPNRDFEKVEEVSPVVGKAEVSNPAGLAGVEKPKTFSDFLADQRKTLTKDKTDAVKMQKYYALTDALGAIGKMAGTAVGGGIGGDTLGGATVVPEYKPSRGYVDAFERARQANDRLRALDDKEFQLAYNQQMRDEDRAYKEKLSKLDRDYRKQLTDYEHQLKMAQIQKDAELENKVKTDIENLKHQHEIEKEKVKGEYELENSRIYQDTVKIMNTGKKTGSGKSGSRSSSEKLIPVIFKDKSVQHISETDLNAIKTSLINSRIGDGKKAITIDQYNVDSIIRDNPELIKELLVNLGSIEAPSVAHVPENTSTKVENTSMADRFERKTPSAKNNNGGISYAPTLINVPSKESMYTKYHLGEADPLLEEEINATKVAKPLFEIVNDGRGGVKIIQTNKA